MPLMYAKSKKAFNNKNKDEMDDDKSQKQALAMAYGVKRHRNYADGGAVDDMPAPSPSPGPQHLEDNADPDKKQRASDSMKKAFGFADGGEVPHPECMAHGGNAEYHSAHPDCMAAHGGEIDDMRENDDDVSDSIMRKRQRPDDMDDADDMRPDQLDDADHTGDAADEIMMKRRYAKGGMVEDYLQDNNNLEEPQMLPELNEEALDHDFDSDMKEMYQPDDSNEMGDSLDDADADERDMLAAIRRKMKKMVR